MYMSIHSYGASQRLYGKDVAFSTVTTNDTDICCILLFLLLCIFDCFREGVEFD